MAGGQEVTALLGGRLALAQPETGYRINVDALWLAAFAGGGARTRHVVDLGAGVGTVGLTLLVSGAARVTLLDHDPAMVALAEANAAPYGTRVQVVMHDVCAPCPEELAHGADLVVCNPPYRIEGKSRPSKHGTARRGPPGSLAGFARTTRAVLGVKGRACFVFPPSDLSALLHALAETGLHPKRVRAVHPLPERPASVMLVEVKPARPSGTRVEPPLVVMRSPGRWTEEAAAILALA